jgi:hypothetical protein
MPPKTSVQAHPDDSYGLKYEELKRNVGISSMLMKIPNRLRNNAKQKANCRDDCRRQWNDSCTA